MNLWVYTRGMKTYLLLFILALTLFTFGHTAVAQEIIPVAPSAQKMPEEELNKLIGTLEDPTGREEFLKNLKALREAQKITSPAVGTTAEPLTERMGVRNFLASFIDSYEHFLNRYALSSSLVHQVIGSLFFMSFFIGLYFGGSFRDYFSRGIGFNARRFQRNFSRSLCNAGIKRRAQ